MCVCVVAACVSDLLFKKLTSFSCFFCYFLFVCSILIFLTNHGDLPHIDTLKNILRGGEKNKKKNKGLLSNLSSLHTYTNTLSTSVVYLHFLFLSATLYLLLFFFIILFKAKIVQIMYVYACVSK